MFFVNVHMIFELARRRVASMVVSGEVKENLMPGASSLSRLTTFWGHQRGRSDRRARRRYRGRGARGARPQVMPTRRSESLTRAVICHEPGPG